MPAARPSLPLSRRAALLQPSATLQMIGRVRSLRDQGVQVLDLTAGEPDFHPPRAAEEAGIEAIRAGRGRYTPAAGLPELREAVVDHLRTDFGLEYAPAEVMVTPGAKLAISQALLALVEEGERVLIPAPYWTSYPEMVRLAGGEPVLVPCDENLLPRVEDLEAAWKEGTSVLLLNTPCNPSGVVLPQERARAIAQWALARGVWVVSDEIYALLTYDGARHVSPIAACPPLREQAVWIGGMSKAYAMTGWRMGFLAAPEALVRSLTALQGQLASSPPAISQVASVWALRNGGEDREAMRRAFERRRRMVVEALRRIPGLTVAEPRGAFYAFPRLGALLGSRDPATGREIRTGADLVEILLEADRVATIAGDAFGAPDAFRLSFAAADEVLEEALRRLAARLAALR